MSLSVVNLTGHCQVKHVQQVCTAAVSSQHSGNSHADLLSMSPPHSDTKQQDAKADCSITASSVSARIDENHTGRLVICKHAEQHILKVSVRLLWNRPLHPLQIRI